MAPAKSQRIVFFYSFMFFLVVSLAGFISPGIPDERKGVHAKLVADYIHSVIEAGRTFYSKQVVERLGKAISIRATENWRKENTLPLPAQFLMPRPMSPRWATCSWPRWPRTSTTTTRSRCPRM